MQLTATATTCPPLTFGAAVPLPLPSCLPASLPPCLPVPRPGDPFAANVRRSLRRQHGLREGVTCVFSVEPTRASSLRLTDGQQFKRSYYGAAGSRRGWWRACMDG